MKIIPKSSKEITENEKQTSFYNEQKEKNKTQLYTQKKINTIKFTAQINHRIPSN